MFKNITDGQRNIENKIYTLAKNKGLSSEEIEPIPDGVGDIKAYCESSPRIMWILKEAYDNYVEDKPAGGEWNLYDEFDNENVWTIPTWQVIAYIVYGVRNEKHWTDMPWVSENTSMVKDLKSVAILNMSKMPAYSSSPTDMTPQYEIWRSILFEH
ncbi:hypothetical protein [Prevotella lacticifex]|uniref:hypothetical protein n=1 Tax=Prevotella lacticifex TaxID=2854755 RepID=UPI001CC42FCE|nr:hypothetical protein [Prevotella lacticifex]